ncbi:MAG TPA: hypothetical protein VFZ59_01695 [Verrucomicrobiae bacterium]|nr:hypothetical protein [Verrucomicrobiae bacterium]
MPDLVFTIKTPAELEGAERAAQALEVSIGKAKGLGKEYEHLETRLKAVKESIEAFKAAQAESSGSPTNETKKLVDESAQYQAALERLAAAQREKADAEAYAALKAEAAAAAQERKRVATEEEAIAKDELSKLTKRYSQEEVDALTASKQAHEEVTQATDKNFTSKKQLKDMVKQLGMEFPLLGQLGRLALNPILLTVAAITAGLQLFKLRVDELSRALGGIEMPDVSQSQVDRINAGSDALKRWAEAGKDVAAEQEISAGFTSRTTAIERQLGATLKLIEARKNLAMSEAKTPEEKADVETKADAQAAEAKRSAEDARIEEMIKKQQALRDLAAKKFAEAGGVTGPGKEEGLEAKYQEAAKAAEKELAAARDRLFGIAEHQSMSRYDPRRLWYDNKFSVQYGDSTYGEAKDMERANMAQQQRIIDQYQRFKENQADRERKRAAKKQAEDLTKEADAMTGPIADEVIANMDKNAVDAEVEDLKSRERANKAAEERRKRDEQKARKEEQERRKRGHDEDNEITAPSPESLRAPQAAVDAKADAVGGAIDRFTESVLARMASFEQKLNDTSSRLTDSMNT